MRPASRVLTPLIRSLLGLLCRVDSKELAKVPAKGPLIVVINHVNFLDGPLLYSYLASRRLVGVAKRETWDNPLLGFLADSWETIPLDREGADLGAMRRIMAALAAGRVVALAPEGTRSGHGRLQRGHGGVAQIALRSGAPVLPVAITGCERFWPNLRRLRRTRVAFRVGESFRLKEPQGGATRRDRLDMTEELMNRLALLLPPRQRGAYPEPENSPGRFLEFTGA